MIYKVSYVVLGGEHPGAIANVEQRPQVGERITFGRQVFEILDVVELMPARSGFCFLHATCQLVHSPQPQENTPDAV